MRKKSSAILLVMAFTALTMIISSNAFAHSNRGNDCSQCHNSTPAPTPVKAGGSSCTKTAADTLKSCKFGVQDAFWLTTAKCDNLAAAEAITCKEQSKTDMSAGNDDCKARSDARKQICKDLGQGIYDPIINPSDFADKIDNPLFPLTPGTTFIYEGITEKGNEHDEVQVTHKTNVILGVTCIEVRDTSTVNGILSEDTLDWYAQDKNGNVWYFGENARQYNENGDIMGLEGSWKAGVDGAKPGVIMENHPQAGNIYRQEFALGVAEDMAQVLSLSESITVNSTAYNNCLKTKEFSPLEPDALEYKFYAPGVGNIQTVDVATGQHLDLVQIKSE
jgi:hypothetical protein